jgi:hypothetical protein
MQSGLARRFTQIKSYKGKGLDDRTAVARFENTPRGLHGMVLSGSYTFFVDVLDWKENLYVSYAKSALPPTPKPINCNESDRNQKSFFRRTQNPGGGVRNHSGPPMIGNELRIYRLAVAVSHRYVDAIQKLADPNLPEKDPLQEAFEAIHRTVDRVNLIYETELGIRFELINSEAELIFTNASNDPYNDDDTSDNLVELNQKTVDRIIGRPNYDVGHLFVVSSGGAGSQPCACNDDFKAQGVSGNPVPAGNAFDVQVVAHELGHQFNASHSFNGTTLGCKYRNRETAYEPGSGSTIMGYSSATNICGAETIQSSADPYFHAISLKEITEYITSSKPGAGDTCPQKISNGNNFSPVINAGPSHSIPQGTPFTLLATSSSDGDGDLLTFNWEEFDLGSPDPPDPQDPNERRKKRPIFRSLESSDTAQRTFPSLASILIAPTFYTAEALPSNSRVMRFRVTARDRRGRYGFDDAVVTVVTRRGSANVGPFVVNSPQVGSVWKLGSSQVVTWDVAGTTFQPINCQHVEISLLINGDLDHPIVLTGSVTNNGSATIIVPGNTPLTSSARVMVRAVGNIFFNLSPGDIQIVP